MQEAAQSFRFAFLGGALVAAAAVGAGAFGAHALKSILDPAMLTVYENGGAPPKCTMLSVSLS
ncbi:MAG: hypothetical protein QM771_05090 [Nitrospira sp.]